MVTRSCPHPQVVPQSWIFSDTRDSDVVSALREVGILEEQQASGREARLRTEILGGMGMIF